MMITSACASNHDLQKSGVSQARCDRECLTQLVNQYLEALVARDPSRLPLTGDVKFTENGDNLRIGDGLWQSAGPLGAYRVFVIDPDSNAAAAQTILTDGQSQVQVLIRLKVKQQRISEIETLIARKGDTCCWDPEKLNSLSPIFNEAVAMIERHTREELITTADAYFTALHTAGTPAYQRAVVDRAMNRYENGRQTTNVVGGNRIIFSDAQSQLDSAMFGRISVVNRRYPVVDTQNGTVLGIVVFEYPQSNRPSEVISEFFKITNGSLREIRAVMVKRPSTGW